MRNMTSKIKVDDVHKKRRRAMWEKDGVKNSRKNVRLSAAPVPCLLKLFEIIVEGKIRAATVRELMT